MSYYQEGHELLQFSQDVILNFFLQNQSIGGQMSLRTSIHQHRRRHSGHRADLE